MKRRISDPTEALPLHQQFEKQVTADNSPSHRQSVAASGTWPIDLPRQHLGSSVKRASVPDTSNSPRSRRASVSSGTGNSPRLRRGSFAPGSSQYRQPPMDAHRPSIDAGQTHRLRRPSVLNANVLRRASTDSLASKVLPDTNHRDSLQALPKLSHLGSSVKRTSVPDASNSPRSRRASVSSGTSNSPRLRRASFAPGSIAAARYDHRDSVISNKSRRSVRARGSVESIPGPMVREESSAAESHESSQTETELELQASRHTSRHPSHLQAFIDTCDEKFEGVCIRKPKERQRAADDEIEEDLEMPQSGHLLQRSKVFKSCSVQLLRQLAGELDECVVKAGDPVYREGEHQYWLAILETGSASLHISTVDPSTHLTFSMRFMEIHAGTLFGELAALGVREERTSTLIADTDCKLLILDGEQLWAAAEDHPSDYSQLCELASRWKAFLSCHLVASCHHEVAYQLRLQGDSITMLQGETAVLSSAAQIDQKVKHYDAAAVVESGRLWSVGDKREAYGVGSSVNEDLAFGMRSSMTVHSPEGPSAVTFLSRHVLWRCVAASTREREHFMKIVLERVPPSTFDIMSCPILVTLQGSSGFWRIIQNLVKQKVCHPGMDIIGPDEPSDALIFFQQGSANISIAGHEIGRISTGGYCGDVCFLGIANNFVPQVRARDFCVLQIVHRSEFEPHLQRHHTVRARFRELSKLRPHYRRDATGAEQTRYLQELSFFQGHSAACLRDLYAVLDDRIYLQDQVMMSPEESAGCMLIILFGSASRKHTDGTLTSIGLGETVGELGLLCVTFESKDTVTATSTCCVQVLHRLLLIKVLKSHPSEKCHLEAKAKNQMRCMSSGGGDTSEHLSNTSIYNLPFFKNCGSRFLYLLDLHLERHMFFSDEVIVEEGTEGEDMYILYSGIADVHVHGNLVGQLSGGTSGELFGEMAVLGLAKKRTATIAAKTLCDVRILSSRSLEAAIKEFPEERARFESLAARRNRKSNEVKAGGQVKRTAMFFKDCDPKFAAAITDLMQDRLYMPGQELMKEGEKGDCMYLVHQGHADIIVNGSHIAEIGDNDYVGEMALLGLSPVRMATVIAKEVCFVQVLNATDLMPVLEQFPEERRKIRLKAAHRFECRHMADSVRCLELFRSAPRAITDILDRYTQRHVFFTDDVIVQEGTTGQHIFMIFSGKARVDIDGEFVTDVGGGDIVGELCALDVAKVRGATITCKEVCDVYSLRQSIIKDTLEKFPEQHGRMKHLAAKRMRENVERKNKVSFLVNCPLFEQCSAKFLQCLTMHLEDKLYMPGEKLCIEGERGDTMFILVSGVLDCVVGEIKVNEMYNGSVIGEIAVLGLSNVRTATLIANKVCLVQMLHRPIFMKYLSEFPREMVQFQEVGTNRLEKTPISKEQNIFRKQLLFNNCEPAFLDELSKRLHRKFFFAGQKIVREGSESNEMYGIQQGQAVIERRGACIGEIDSGQCFGEMAVMGITGTQTVTVRAETLCDMQVLARCDLEELMQEHRPERKRLLRVIASMMREDLAEVTNLEIITEIPIFHGADIKFLQLLEQASDVELARKEEMLLHENENAMLVLLQGMARVEINGVPVRNLSEGDHFGSIFVLNEQDASRTVTARAISVCLALMFTQSALEDCASKIPKGQKFLDELRARIQVDNNQDLRRQAISECSILQNLLLSETRLEEMLPNCEEAIAMPGEAILHDDSEVIVFVVSGKLSIVSGMDTLTLPKGSSYGEMSSDGTGGVAPTVHAEEISRVLLLWRPAFFAILDSWDDIERSAALVHLDAMPRRQRDAKTSGTSLRHRTDWIAAQYVKSVSMSLRVKVGKPKPFGGKKLLWKAVKKATVLRTMDGLKHSKTQDLTFEEDTPAKKKYQVAMDHQEHVLKQDLHRLTAIARQAYQEARAEEAHLRHYADVLRAQARNIEQGLEETGTASKGMDLLDTSEFSSLRKQNAIANQRIQNLRSKLDIAYQQREGLLHELRQLHTI